MKIKIGGSKFELSDVCFSLKIINCCICGRLWACEEWILDRRKKYTYNNWRGIKEETDELKCWSLCERIKHTRENMALAMALRRLSSSIDRPLRHLLHGGSFCYLVSFSFSSFYFLFCIPAFSFCSCIILRIIHDSAGHYFKMERFQFRILRSIALCSPVSFFLPLKKQKRPTRWNNTA